VIGDGRADTLQRLWKNYSKVGVQFEKGDGKSMTQELFDEINARYGCGYWHSCWEHACPCKISMNCNGVYNKDIDDKLKRAAEEEADW